MDKLTTIVVQQLESLMHRVKYELFAPHAAIETAYLRRLLGELEVAHAAACGIRYTEVE